MLVVDAQFYLLIVVVTTKFGLNEKKTGSKLVFTEYTKLEYFVHL